MTRRAQSPIGTGAPPAETGAAPAKRGSGIDATMRPVPISRDLYESLVEYFDNIADADTDSDGVHPNEEMRLLTHLREAAGE